jgi:serine/threonine-protein kinase
VSTVPEPEPGDVLGGYRLEAVLGVGTMGQVFRAVREADGQPVALKVVKGQLARDTEYRQRFRREARAAAEVRHPNLVSIIEAGEADGREFLAVGLVIGDTLQEYIARGPLAIGVALRVASDIASGLDALHAAEVVHRDIKPSNVMLAEDGTALLTDFGLAKGRAYTLLTRPGQVVGTLDYLAPELVRGKPASAASDIYAFGCLVFECFVGKPPFADRPTLDVGIAHLRDPPPDPHGERPDLPQALAATVLEALRKDPAGRPPSAGTYAARLAAAAGEPE